MTHSLPTRGFSDLSSLSVGLTGSLPGVLSLAAGSARRTVVRTSVKDSAVDISARKGARTVMLNLNGRPVACTGNADPVGLIGARSEEHTSELQSLMRISYADLCLKKKKQTS